MVTKTEFQKRAIRHGEVVLIPIEKLPDGLEIIEKGTRVTVGFSESHHHHIAVSDSLDITMLRPIGADDQGLYLEVKDVARVEHLKEFDRHETKVLHPGYYFVNTKAAYDYFLKAQRRVVD